MTQGAKGMFQFAIQDHSSSLTELGQKLKGKTWRPKPQRKAVYWLTLWRMLRKFPNAAQTPMLMDRSTYSVLSPPSHIKHQLTCHKNSHWPLSPEHFLSGDFLFPGHARLCQGDNRINQHILHGLSSVISLSCLIACLDSCPRLSLSLKWYSITLNPHWSIPLVQ